MSMITLGLVGTPASGKSRVASLLEASGAVRIDADQIAKQVLDRPELRDAIVRVFGADVIVEFPSDRHGGSTIHRVDRKKIASMVFGGDRQSRERLGQLESLVHPETRSEIRRQWCLAAASDAPLVVLDVPLLFESGWDLACDAVWCVDAPRTRRETWAAERSWDEGELSRRENNQLAIDFKRGRSDLFVLNSGTIGDLDEAVQCGLEDWLGASDLTSRPAAAEPRCSLAFRSTA